MATPLYHGYVTYHKGGWENCLEFVYKYINTFTSKNVLNPGELLIRIPILLTLKAIDFLELYLEKICKEELKNKKKK